MKLRFVNKQPETATVWSYIFEPITLVRWQAGQSIRLELPRPTFGVDERRFTISSAPYQKHITITTRQSNSTFKQSIYALQPGQVVDAFAIEGSFVWGRSTRPRIFVAGGVGITPFHSMLLQCIHEQRPINATLLYSSSDQQAVFKAWLDDCQKQHDLQVRYFKNTRVTAEDIQRLPYWQKSLVYLSGSSQMVDALGSGLLASGLPEKQLKRDWFTGNVT